MSRKQCEQTVFAMMMTSTGRAICDSGDAYGRHWQRNQMAYKSIEDVKKTPEVEFEQPEQWYTLKNNEGQFVRRFKSEEEARAYIVGHSRTYTVEKETLDSSDIDYTVSIFHHLVKSLTIDEICEQYNALPCESWDSEDVYGASNEQLEWLKSQGMRVGDSWNSYNGDCNLSQTIQGANVYSENDTADEYPTYVLLQLHQGCDVRGGYTDAKLFKIDNDSDYFTTNPNVYGEIDGVQVDTGYNGYSLTDENGQIVPVTVTSKIDLYL